MVQYTRTRDLPAMSETLAPSVEAALGLQNDFSIGGGSEADMMNGSADSGLGVRARGKSKGNAAKEPLLNAQEVLYCSCDMLRGPLLTVSGVVCVFAVSRGER